MAKYDYEDRSKNSFLRNLGMGLSEGAMAMGQGMTGQPFLSNFQNMQMKRQEIAKEQKNQAAMQAFRDKLLGGGLGGGIGMGQDMGITGGSVDPITGETKLTFGQTSGGKVKEQVAAEAGKKAAGSERDFLIAKGKLRTTMGAFKAMVEQSGGSGRVAGFKNLFEGTTGKNPYVKAYQGQLVEAAASLAKLAAPSARVGQEIIQAFKKTLPTQFSTMDEAVNQIRFSLHNAFATTLGQSGQEYTDEIRQQVDEFVKDIVDTPPLRLDGVKEKPEHYFKTENEATSANLPKGTVIFINGKRARVK